MLITNELIKSLNPCKKRLDNYLQFYKDKSHTKAQFMGLKNITHEDKIWVAFRLMPKENLKLAAADIAESVLHLFEEKYPKDKRPRKAIEVARNGNFNTAADAAAYAATYAAATYAAADAVNAAAAYAATYAAADAVNAAAVNAAADAAAYAAAYAADTAAYVAAYAAANAAANAAYAADAAAYAARTARAACAAKLKQEKLIKKIILKYWR